jgi:drug/metabolite transporter (DMT)-like permease
MILKLRLRAVDPRAIMFGALTIAAAVLTPPALANPPDGHVPTEAIVAIVVLAVFCTATAFVLFAMLNAEVGPSRSSVITYVAPAVAVLLGVIALDESLGIGAIVGFALILVGSYFATSSEPPSDSA